MVGVTEVITVRRATLEDVEGIATVIQDVWEQPIDVEVCHSQIKNETCAVWVATEGDGTSGEVAGFVSAFLTIGQDGARRWEVDLLAVRRASRGQRLGQKLVEATWADARKHQVKMARAAVRVDNLASQRSFERAGYTTDLRVHKLLLWLPQPAEGQIVYPHQVTLLPVNTLTYRGLWIEGLTVAGVSEDEQRRAVTTARTLIAQQGRLNTGALIPAEDEGRLADDVRAMATGQGEYHWWQKTPEEVIDEA
jgi:ribosomal protein S18 acetylase RimI-like enzyme